MSNPYDRAGKPRASGDDPDEAFKLFTVNSKPRASGDDPGVLPGAERVGK